MPRPIHFEIHAADPQRAIAFYSQLFGWTFTQWGTESYWLVGTGERSEPGIDGGLTLRRGDAPAEMAAVNAFVCTVGVDDLDAMVGRLTALGGKVALPKMPMRGPAPVKSSPCAPGSRGTGRPRAFRAR